MQTRSVYQRLESLPLLGALVSRLADPGVIRSWLIILGHCRGTSLAQGRRPRGLPSPLRRTPERSPLDPVWQVLLLDEPLAALDLKLRQRMLIELDLIHDDVGITFLYVTHDQGEALTMSDRIAVMSHGKVLQCGCFRGFVADSCNGFESAFSITPFGLSWGNPGKSVVHCPVRGNGISGPEGFPALSEPGEKGAELRAACKRDG